MSTENLSRLSEKAVKLAIRSGADQAQAVAYTRSEDLTRFANSQIHQNMSARSGGLDIRVSVKKRLGDIRSDALDLKSVELAVKNAIKVAKVSPPNELFKSLPVPKKIVPLAGIFDRKTADCPPNYRADCVRQLIQTAHGKSTIVKAVAGSYMTGSACFLSLIHI